MGVIGKVILIIVLYLMVVGPFVPKPGKALDEMQKFYPRPKNKAD